jgi:hypothetical protein
MAFESLPVAVILLFWNLLAVVAGEQHVGGSVSSAGVVMAALYVVVRGVSLSTEMPPPTTDDVRTLLYENALLAVPAGAWFVAAMLANALGELLFVYGPPSLVSSVVSSLAGAGLGVVGLYAVAAGYAAIGAGNAAGGRPPVDCDGGVEDGRADDETGAEGATADD